MTTAMGPLTPLFQHNLLNPQRDAKSIRDYNSPESSHMDVMDTKMKIIDILQFIMDLRLDMRITNLLVIYKQHYNESTHQQEEGVGRYIDMLCLVCMVKLFIIIDTLGTVLFLPSFSFTILLQL